MHTDDFDPNLAKERARRPGRRRVTPIDGSVEAPQGTKAARTRVGSGQSAATSSVFIGRVCFAQIDGATIKVVERGLPIGRFTTARWHGAWRRARHNAAASNSCRHRAARAFSSRRQEQPIDRLTCTVAVARELMRG